MDQVLAEMSAWVEALYSKIGRPSVPPERLPRALLLQIFYSVLSEPGTGPTILCASESAELGLNVGTGRSGGEATGRFGSYSSALLLLKRYLCEFMQASPPALPFVSSLRRFVKDAVDTLFLEGLDGRFTTERSGLAAPVAHEQ